MTREAVANCVRAISAVVSFVPLADGGIEITVTVPDDAPLTLLRFMRGDRLVHESDERDASAEPAIPQGEVGQ